MKAKFKINDAVWAWEKPIKNRGFNSAIEGEIKDISEGKYLVELTNGYKIWNKTGSLSKRDVSVSS